MRFLKIVDQVGGTAFSLVIGWVMVCFTLMSLNTAPLAKNFLVGSFQPGKAMFFGTAPDHEWIAFAWTMWHGPLCRGTTAADETTDYRQFIKQFIDRYDERRGEVEKAAQPKQ